MKTVLSKNRETNSDQMLKNCDFGWLDHIHTWQVSACQSQKDNLNLVHLSTWLIKLETSHINKALSKFLCSTAACSDDFRKEREG